jgi:hypothetical protein
MGYEYWLAVDNSADPIIRRRPNSIIGVNKYACKPMLGMKRDDWRPNTILQVVKYRPIR